jgi:hypothetical protein
MAKESLPVIAAIIVQFITILALLFAPIGFDHPSALGLDFDDGVKLFFVYVLALVFGATTAIIQRKWKLLVVQLLGVLALASPIFIYGL